MTLNLHLPDRNELLRPTITVIGVGGAGGNAVNNMIAANLEGVSFVVANTDAQALDHSLTERTIQLGAGVTKGLGAGANPDVGRAAAEEARDEISAYIEGSNMVFITAGMGGGTGTGAAPAIARIAKEQGILTVAVVTKPFQFEGAHRMRLAEAGLKELQDYVDTLIVIPNQNLFRIANERTTFADAFKMADDVLHSGVRGVTDLMVKPGLINLDFADIRTVMREMGKAMMGTGEATGERRAIESAEAAISNPLLDDVSLKGARALLVNITGGTDMTLFEVDEAMNRVREEVDPEANIIFGSTFHDDLQGRMRVSVVATGIDAQTQINNTPAQKVGVSEPKKPYVFSQSPVVKPDAAKPVVARPMGIEAIRTQAAEPAPARAQAEMRPLPPRVEKAAEMIDEQAAEQHLQAIKEAIEAQDLQDAPQDDLRMSLREPASAATPQDISPRQAAGNAIRQQQSREDNNARGFFQRMADVGRSLSVRNDAPRAEITERVQVVQKDGDTEDAQKKGQGEDQYLDIPAFLRRQAN
ncbi:MAG: cell division protein FtsZ [Rickettsiales bacterium]|nr:cell division protein FtsZ [Rickettsiales bacterium]